MYSEIVSYSDGEVSMKGYLAYDAEFEARRPAVIIAHAWRGLDDFVREKAHALAELGYIGFAADLYGHGTTAQTDDEASALMIPLFVDRQRLRNRIVAAYDFISKYHLTDIERIGGIGFCFGGLTMLELLRSGVNVKGIVSFHGVLADQMGNVQAKTLEAAEQIKGSVLLLHGHDDPLVSRIDIEKVQSELTQAKLDWQMHIYGKTAHAFTNPQMHDSDKGLVYSPLATLRSWQSMENFFDEVFL